MKIIDWITGKQDAKYLSEHRVCGARVAGGGVRAAVFLKGYPEPGRFSEEQDVGLGRREDHT